MELTKKALSAITENMKLRNRILIETEVHFTTLHRWVESNSDNLTKASILQIIREETGLTDDEILTETETVKK